MQVGTIVKLKMGCLGNDVGTIGVCYETYNLGTEQDGCSCIFENGRYDGFSFDEQLDFLEDAGYDARVAQYEFTNVIQLDRDFQSGMFDSVFKGSI